MVEEFDWDRAVAKGFENARQSGFDWIEVFEPNGIFGSGVSGWNGIDSPGCITAFAISFDDELVVEFFADERRCCLADYSGKSLGFDGLLFSKSLFW